MLYLRRWAVVMCNCVLCIVCVLVMHDGAYTCVRVYVWLCMFVDTGLRLGLVLVLGFGFRYWLREGDVNMCVCMLCCQSMCVVNLNQQTVDGHEG